MHPYPDEDEIIINGHYNPTPVTTNDIVCGLIFILVIFGIILSLFKIVML